MKVARDSFSGSIPAKFEHKLHRHKHLEKLPPQLCQIKMKICYDQGCNDIGVVIATKWRYYLFYLQKYFSALGTVLQKSFTGAFSSNSGLDVRIEIFWDEVFMVRNTVKNGQYCCLAVICRKWSAFDMQFHLIVVSIFLKMCVKDDGDSSGQLLQRRIWLVCIMALLLAVLQTFRSTLTN